MLSEDAPSPVPDVKTVLAVYGVPSVGTKSTAPVCLTTTNLPDPPVPDVKLIVNPVVVNDTKFTALA